MTEASNEFNDLDNVDDIDETEETAPEPKAPKTPNPMAELRKQYRDTVRELKEIKAAREAEAEELSKYREAAETAAASQFGLSEQDLKVFKLAYPGAKLDEQSIATFDAEYGRRGVAEPSEVEPAAPAQPEPPKVPFAPSMGGTATPGKKFDLAELKAIRKKNPARFNEIMNREALRPGTVVEWPDDM